MSTLQEEDVFALDLQKLAEQGFILREGKGHQLTTLWNKWSHPHDLTVGVKSKEKIHYIVLSHTSQKTK